MAENTTCPDPRCPRIRCRELRHHNVRLGGIICPQCNFEHKVPETLDDWTHALGVTCRGPVPTEENPRGRCGHYFIPSTVPQELIEAAEKWETHPLSQKWNGRTKEAA